VNYKKGWIEAAADTAMDVQANLSELGDLISFTPCDRSRLVLEKALRHNRALVAMVEARRGKGQGSGARS
jgi:hypothetical protein